MLIDERDIASVRKREWMSGLLLGLFIGAVIGLVMALGVVVIVVAALRMGG